MIDHFLKNGWVIVDVKPLKFIGDLIPFISPDCDNVTAKKLHIEYSEKMWKSEFSLIAARFLAPIMWNFLSLDLMVQYNPYLRIARPNKPQDNIGYHKDTQYGQTPYELAVHIPFVDLDEKSAIRVISGSHLMPESKFSLVTPEGPRIEKGSIENHMGKPYSPKCLKVPEGMETTPLAMKVGQCAIFSPAIFHGQEVNEGDATRVSCDLRFVNSRAPVQLKLGKIHAGYVAVSQSPVEMMAQKYYEAQI